MPRQLGVKIRCVLAFVLALCFFYSSPTNASLKDLNDEINSLLDNVQVSVVTVFAFHDTDPFGPNYASLGHVDTLIGSGIVYDTLGHIVTTGHVIRGSNRFEIHTWDGLRYSAVLVGIDSKFDLSVLEVVPGRLKPLSFADDRPVRSGSILFAVGNSYGVPNSASLATAVGYREDGYLQISTNLTPGFSGGPVVNTSGELVGMISAKLTEPVLLGGLDLYQDDGELTNTWSFSGASLELPSTGVILSVQASDLKITVDGIIEGFNHKTGFLGVQPESMSGEFLTKVFGLSNGVMVSKVLRNSPAWKVGLRAGDILTQFLGRELRSADQLRNLIKENRPGDLVTLKAFRDGKTISYTVQLTSSDFYSYHLTQTDLSGTYETAAKTPETTEKTTEQRRTELENKLNRLMLEVQGQMKTIREIEKELDALKKAE